MEYQINLVPVTKLGSFGDPIERQLATRVEAVFPSYSRIWEEYVGNDGQSNALPMPGATPEAVQSRAEYWQRLYTIFESLALCWDIEHELSRVEQATIFKCYAHNLNLWMAFYCHLGRIHDMVKAIAVPAPVKRRDLVEPFNQFWKDRHIVLHGPKVPLKWVGNVVALPPLGTDPKCWNDKMLWTELKAKEFEFIAATVTSALRELERRLDWCVAELRKILPQILHWQRVVWPEPGVLVAASLPSSSGYLSNDGAPGISCQPSGTQQLPSP
jgi:hypothetical protein